MRKKSRALHPHRTEDGLEEDDGLKLLVCRGAHGGWVCALALLLARLLLGRHWYVLWCVVLRGGKRLAVRILAFCASRKAGKGAFVTESAALQTMRGWPGPERGQGCRQLSELNSVAWAQPKYLHSTNWSSEAAAIRANEPSASSSTSCCAGDLRNTLTRMKQGKE